MTNLTFRPATMDDARLLFWWRNHPDTRAGMFDSRSFTYEEHVVWLDKTMRSVTKVLGIAEDDGVPVATYRLDGQIDGLGWRYEVSITVAPVYRGKGYAARVLSAVRSDMLSKPEVTELVARIKPTNIASIKAFTKAGFVEQSRSESEVVMVGRHKPIVGNTNGG